MKKILLSIFLILNGAAKADSLKEVYACYFPVGTAISDNELREANPATMATIRNNFGILTAENAFKWDAIHPKEGTYDFKGADRIADFARENGFKLWGHVLVWHLQTPDWVFKDGCKKASRELVLQRMREHIHTVMNRYKDVIYGWDVVNEVLSDDKEAYLRESKWLEIVGEDFIEKAFSYAMEVETDALLSYNDYSLPNPHKRANLIKLVKGLMDAGIRIDTVGFQSHYSLYYPQVEEVEKTIRMVADLGLKVSISEIDMSVFHYEDKSNRYKDGLPKSLELYQGYRYAQLMDLYTRLSDDIERVTFWNIYDAHNWKNYFPVRGRMDYAGLINRNGEPKAAFYAVMDRKAYLAKFGEVKPLKPPHE